MALPKRTEAHLCRQCNQCDCDEEDCPFRCGTDDCHCPEPGARA